VTPAGEEGEPREATDRQVAWSAAWRRHRAVATAGEPDPGPPAAGVRALRPLPGVMVGATAAMVAVTVGLTAIAGPLYGYTERAAHDLLDRTPYVEAVFTDPVPAEEGE